MKVIGFVAGPGAGKSTAALQLAGHMKREGKSVEYVHEYAKDVVWEGRTHLLDNQLYIFAKQEKMQRQLIGKVDYCITDSPLLLEIFYLHQIMLGLTGQDLKAAESLLDTIMEFYKCYDNQLVFVKRGQRQYSEDGRMQTEKEAMDIDNNILAFLNVWGYGYLIHETGTPIEDLAKRL